MLYDVPYCVSLIQDQRLHLGDVSTGEKGTEQRSLTTQFCFRASFHSDREGNSSDHMLTLTLTLPLCQPSSTRSALFISLAAHTKPTTLRLIFCLGDRQRWTDKVNYFRKLFPFYDILVGRRSIVRRVFFKSNL